MIQYEAEKEANTFQTQEEREKRSAAIYRIIANEVKPRSIKMKEDIPYNHHNQLLPILDTQMGVVNGQVVFHHFSKKMSSLEVVLERSSMSMGAKMAILVEEGNRRLRTVQYLCHGTPNSLTSTSSWSKSDRLATARG